MSNLNITLPDGRHYPIHIGQNSFEACAEFLRDKRVIFISDEDVAPRWRNAIDCDAPTLTLPAGESTKSFAQLESLLNQLLALKPDRQTTLAALGGGVVGDITGFAASVLLRGVPFVQLPTTLLSQVDSSVGGKTGINTDYGKNLIGSFYQPQGVFIDTRSLGTLPDRQMRCGFAEVIKSACIADVDFFAWLQQHHEAVLAKDEQALTHAIEQTVRIKARIVEEDEKESGARALLNLGHTFGHALEKAFGYDGRLLHGEAVAIGMVMAYDYASELGQCSPGAATSVRLLVERSGLPTKPEYWPEAEALLEDMRQDKKSLGGKITLVLPVSNGRCRVETNVDEQSLIDFLTRTTQS